MASAKVVPSPSRPTTNRTGISRLGIGLEARESRLPPMTTTSATIAAMRQDTRCIQNNASTGPERRAEGFHRRDAARRAARHAEPRHQDFHQDRLRHDGEDAHATEQDCRDHGSRFVGHCSPPDD